MTGLVLQHVTLEVLFFLTYFAVWIFGAVHYGVRK